MTKTVTTLQTNGYEDGLKAVSKLTANDFLKGITGINVQNQNFTVFSSGKNEVCKYQISYRNGISQNFDTLKSVKNFLQKNVKVD